MNDQVKNSHEDDIVEFLLSGNARSITFNDDTTVVVQSVSSINQTSKTVWVDLPDKKSKEFPLKDIKSAE